MTIMYMKVKTLGNYSERENKITLEGPKGAFAVIYQPASEPLPQLGDEWMLGPLDVVVVPAPQPETTMELVERTQGPMPTDVREFLDAEDQAREDTAAGITGEIERTKAEIEGLK